MVRKDPPAEPRELLTLVRQAKLQIAIDGPAGAGKSTVAKKIATKLSYLYIDTGAMYRAATLLVMNDKLSLDNPDAIARALAEAKIELKQETASGESGQSVFLNGVEITNEIRSHAVTSFVSSVSALSVVRDDLVAKQRMLAAGGKAVLDGRDIGTVVLPGAQLKIFLTASPAVRARRRFEELVASGKTADQPTILKEIIERDERDSTRAIAPLKQADDAILVLTDNLSADQVADQIIAMAAQRC
jgi:cytidylate kinase